VVESAGVDAVQGAEPCASMIEEARRREMDVSALLAHRSRPSSKDMISAADLVLVMDRPGRAHVQRQLPSSHSRTFTVRQAALLMTSVGSVCAMSGQGQKGLHTITDLVTEMDRHRSIVGPSEKQSLRVPRRPWRRIDTNTFDVPDAHDGQGDHSATFAVLLPAIHTVGDGLARALQC
jgi:protein-tyrosine-phosphatase